jgi:hypothetical protein
MFVVFSVSAAQTGFYELFEFCFVEQKIKETVGQFPVVGILTRCCNGVTNKPLFFSFKTITSYKNSGSKPGKTLSVVTK